MRILLTGRRGQMGVELEPLLARHGELTALDRDALDLSDAAQIQRVVGELKPDLIVNTAAYTAVDQAESEPDVAMEVNGVAPGVLAGEAKRLGALLVHFSTDYVFDGAKATAYVEDDPTNPLNVYGRSKLEGERRILASGCGHLILRTSWVYGPRGKNFLLTILKAMREGRQLRVVGDQFGAPTSSVAIADAAMQCVQRGAEGLYHMSAAGRTTWHGFAEAVARDTGYQKRVDPISSAEYGAKARRPRNSVLDNSRLADGFGIRLAPWRDALRDVLEQIK